MSEAADNSTNATLPSTTPVHAPENGISSHPSESSTTGVKTEEVADVATESEAEMSVKQEEEPLKGDPDSLAEGAVKKEGELGSRELHEAEKTVEETKGEKQEQSDVMNSESATTTSNTISAVNSAQALNENGGPAPTKEESSAADFLRETFDSFAKQSSAAASAAGAGTTLSAIEMLRQRIGRDRRDGDAWLGLIDDAMHRADLPALRAVYQDFFQVYPNAARQWQDYASVELSHSEFANVESIFTRCLRSTPSTDLWQSYLSYTRRVNPLPPAEKGSGENSERERVRKVIEGAYDFALRFIGHSRDAGDVWREYIMLLKERETSNQWQSGQKMDDIRRTYQRAVAIPLSNVEQIWREYDAYENGLNRITAKKFLGDRSPAYMTARGVLREMQMLTQSLHRPLIPRPPCWCMPPSLNPIVSPLTIVRDRHHVESWKKYLRWEESNPLQLGSGDDVEGLAALQSRVLMAYRKAAMHMRFYPEIWYMASQFLLKSGREDDAVTWLQNGLDACTGSALLTFAFVDQAERRGQTQGCGARFESLLDWIHNEIDQLDLHLRDKLASIDQEAEQLKANAAARKRDEGAAVDEVAGEEREEARKMEEGRERRRTAEREQVRPRVEELKEFAGLVWIKFMHFVRRTEGQRPSRSIFARARKSKHCTWQVFEANALMEYHCSKDVAVATKVFELALKTFGQDEAFVVRYLDFLLSINDDNNARALFERTVGNFTPDRARPIWDRWCDYEYSFGDSSSIFRLDERLSALYPDERATKRLLDRNSYMDLDIVGPRDLGLRAGAAAGVGASGGGGGATAAERAVAASRDYASETFEGVHALSSSALSSVPEDAALTDQPYVKRARMANDRASATPPPTSLRGNPPTGPRGVKRSVSPPSRYVPPPRGEPPTGPSSASSSANVGGTARGGVGSAASAAASAYLEVPSEILYFLDALPRTASFDGPTFSADDIVECLLRSSLPDVTPSSSSNNNAMHAGTLPSSARASSGGGRSGRRGMGRSGRRH